MVAFLSHDFSFLASACSSTTWPRAKLTSSSTGSISKNHKGSGTMKAHSKAKRRTAPKNATTGSAKSDGRSGQRSSPTGKGESGSSASAGHGSAKNLPTSVEEFDRRFDEGEDLVSLGVDLSKARRPGLEIKRVNVDMPAHFISRLDHWAAVRGLSRQALIKSWLYDRLEQESKV